jgi:hypothetical protein
MATEHILALLIAERDKLTRAIDALQGPIKRLGRPPKKPPMIATSVAAQPPNPAPAPRKRKKRRFSAAQREAAAERMRQRWAAKKKAEAKLAKKS